MNIEKTLNKELNKSLKEDEVPVSALIVSNKKIIASSHNTKENQYDVCAHAEINCIRKVCKERKNTNLSDCEIYVTVSPCKMCLEAIKAAKIKKIHYYLKKAKQNNFKCLLIKEKCSEKYRTLFKQVLLDFFKSKR